jgi:hypothetical protein
MKTFAVRQLSSADLHVDAIYEGGRNGNTSDDPLPPLLSVSNSGGFRYRGRLPALELVVLTSTFSDPDWPDALDRETGVYTYFGDNKRPGVALHETGRKGNEILRILFGHAQSGVERRLEVPPVFVFGNTGNWRDVIFLGLAVPGTTDLRVSEDLVAIWKIAGGRRFQNYRARFTIMDVPTINRAWINDIILGHPNTTNAPPPWLHWKETGHYRPLRATPSVEHRGRKDQLPSDASSLAIIQAIHAFFAGRPHGFERCAAALARLMLPEIVAIDLTRPSRDGGRDAVGQLRIGAGPSSILVDFALEAKCYSLNNAVGVREMSRLISRLRHRQFGILITTSCVDTQAYKEIKEDQHPIIVMAALDIINLLRANGFADLASVIVWLEKEFPQTASLAGID